MTDIRTVEKKPARASHNSGSGCWRGVAPRQYPQPCHPKWKHQYLLRIGMQISGRFRSNPAVSKPGDQSQINLNVCLHTTNVTLSEQVSSALLPALRETLLAEPRPADEAERCQKRLLLGPFET